MNIDEAIKIHLSSRCPFVYLVSWEEERILTRLTPALNTLFSRIYTWTVTEGLAPLNGKPLDEKYKGPYETLNFIASNNEKALFLLLDFHPYISEAKITRKMRDLIHNLQSTSSCVMILSPKLTLPKELEKDIAVLDYPLPGLEDVKSLFRTIEAGVKNNPRLSIKLNEEEKEKMLQAALGLTENEAKNVFAKALVTDSTLDIKDISLILEEKQQLIRKSGILEYYPAADTFSAVGGMDELKTWLKARAGAFTKKARDFKLPLPKGLLLLGVPGCGKSLTAKAVATEWRQPLLKLDVGRLFGGLVGSSEENIRRTIHLAEAVAPAVLWIDEIEKGFSGVKSAGDSGTTARVFSTFLTWMQEKTSPIFVIATANDISSLPPELLRKGRFDEIFFVDLPFAYERESIFDIHIKKKGRDAGALGIDLKSLAKESEGFSGAEIEQVVTDALFKAFAAGGDLNSELIARSLKETYPLAETMKETIMQMRTWAQFRARYASSHWRSQDGEIKKIERWAGLGDLCKPS